jgi:hypothetical protein
LKDLTLGASFFDSFLDGLAHGGNVSIHGEVNDDNLGHLGRIFWMI